MAVLNTVNIGKSTFSSYTWYMQQKHFTYFYTGLGTPLYLHFKTNINLSGVMYMIEATGYNYGWGAPIKCAWGFHLSSGALYSAAASNGYSGLQANGTYMSSDGYVVIRGYAGTHYYTGFSLSAYSTRNDTGGQNVSLLATVQTDNSGNYY